MDDVRDSQGDDAAVDEGESKLTEPMYVYTGPKIIADSKMRLAKWLERRGW